MSDVRRAAAAIERAERANGFTDADARVGLLLNIESPQALRCAAELACAHARVAADKVQIVYGD